MLKLIGFNLPTCFLSSSSNVFIRLCNPNPETYILTKLEQLSYEDSNELINQVIKRLLVPTDQVATNVSKQFSNELNINSEVQAYAKISGRTWTYYVKTLKIVIGRSTDSLHGHSHSHTPSMEDSIEGVSGMGGNSTNSESVDIDLGPSKVVSRRHAVIQYNLDARRWELFVYGRNGIKVDGVRLNLPYGAPYVLGSGNILDIGGTQMMFILPDAAPSIADSFLKGLQRYYNPDKRPRTGIFTSGGGYYGPSGRGGFTSDGLKRGTDYNNGNGIKAFQMYSKNGSTMTETSEGETDDQDYSREEAKDMKPPYSYATMITRAILSNPQGVLSLSEIYSWISSHFAYYRYSKQGWQNSIRHNLSLNKAFEKVPRKPDEPGKGMKWQISGAYRREFMKKWHDGTLNKGKRGTSVARQLQLHLMRNHMLPDSGRKPLPVSAAKSHHKRRSSSQRRKREDTDEGSETDGQHSRNSSNGSSILSNGTNGASNMNLNLHGASATQLTQPSPPALSQLHHPPSTSNPDNAALSSAISGLNSLSNSPVRNMNGNGSPSKNHDALGYMAAVASAENGTLRGSLSLAINLSPSRLTRGSSNLSSPIKPLALPDFKQDYGISGGPMLTRQDSSQERSTASPKKDTNDKHSPLRESPSRGGPQSRQSTNQSSALWNYVEFPTPSGTSKETSGGQKQAEAESPLKQRKGEI